MSETRFRRLTRYEDIQRRARELSIQLVERVSVGPAWHVAIGYPPNRTSWIVEDGPLVSVPGEISHEQLLHLADLTGLPYPVVAVFWEPVLPVADQANAELDRAKREGMAKKPAPAIAVAQAFRPGDVVSHRGSGRGGGTVTHTYHGGTDVAVAWPDGYQMDYPAQPLSLERLAPAIAAEPVVVHLADGTWGNQRPLCAAPPGSGAVMMRMSRRVYLEPPPPGEARCEICLRRAAAQQAERAQPDLVGAAPAARPRLTIACQSQYDPEE